MSHRSLNQRKNNDPSPLLLSKILVPTLKSGLVSRQRLVQSLNKGWDTKLTVISAPPGFGKTTLLTDWARQSKAPVAWFSIDSGDNNPLHFLKYVIAALQREEPDVGKTAMNLLQSPQRPSIETILINILNDVLLTSKEMALVLDDYHLVENEAIHRMIGFFIDHLPQKMHLYLAARSDPPLSLSRLRSQSQLIEVRAGDLSFRMDETVQLLNTKLHLDLSSENIHRLESRTEGWIAGLQLAALSIQGRENASAFIQDFKGDNRYIADYLMEEVLNRQPEHIHHFLLKTSILDPLTGALCDAVTGTKDSREMLAMMERSNLFVFPLDVEGNWYRYHRLFADLLQQRLKQGMKEILPELHLKAGQWYSRNGFKENAVDHFLAGGEFDRAAEIIEDIAEFDWDRGMESRLWRWFRHLPEEKIAQNPYLCIFHARELFENAKQEAAEEWLNTAEKLFKETQVSPHEVRKLKGRIAVIRAVMSAYCGKIEDIISYTQESLKLLPQEDMIWRSVAATTEGFAYGWSGEGDLKKAEEAFAEALEWSRSADNIYFILLAGSCLAGVVGLQANVNRALKIYSDLLPIAEERGFLESGPVSTIYSGIGAIYIERGDLEQGIRLIQKGIQTAERVNDPIALSSCRFSLIRALLYKNKYKEARQVLQSLEESAKHFIMPPWMMHNITAMKIFLYLVQGNLEAAAALIEDKELRFDDELCQRKEAEHIALANFMAAQGRLDDAESLCARLISCAEKGNRVFNQIEVRILRALIAQKNGEEKTAVEEIKSALALAEPNGLLGIFTRKGSVVKRLLENVFEETASTKNRKDPCSKSYIKKILLAFKAVPSEKRKGSVELLSDRELEVLLLISGGLSNQEIAQKLFISLNTVRTHTKNINLKLGVHSRTQAVARAKELELL
ncbi:MAG: hypothetical protein JXB26_16525 [Candidatus Aminicenantes bacterium]|nr:hypothetical protein [Candidatus Aminicenantes bacterium]